MQLAGGCRSREPNVDEQGTRQTVRRSAHNTIDGRSIVKTDRRHRLTHEQHPSALCSAQRPECRRAEVNTATAGSRSPRKRARCLASNNMAYLWMRICGCEFYMHVAHELLLPSRGDGCAWRRARQLAIHLVGRFSWPYRAPTCNASDHLIWYNRWPCWSHVPVDGNCTAYQILFRRAAGSYDMGAAYFARYPRAPTASDRLLVSCGQACCLAIAIFLKRRSNHLRCQVRFQLELCRSG